MNIEYLTLEDLFERYDVWKDESDIAAIEEEISKRKGFATLDDYYAHSSKQSGNLHRTYTTRIQEQDLLDLKSQPFYLLEEDGTISLEHNTDGATAVALCDFCSHLDFEYLLTHLIPRNELSLGPLKNILQKQGCAFCRLVVASIQLSLKLHDLLIASDDDKAIEVGLASTRKGPGIETYDLELLIFPWSHDIYPSIRIQRMSDDGESAAFCGRPIDPLQINFCAIKAWLHQCECKIGGHTLADAKPTGDDPFTPNYLIDVVENRVVEPEDECRYFALSYAWGGPQPLQLRLGTVEKLISPNALKLRTLDVPATIRDAMQLVREIGERYLWVDALCIVQDITRSKEPALRTMDRVYEHAVLTIIASHGSSVHAGLPGVSAGTKNALQHVETVQGIRLVHRLLQSEATVNRSVWNSRSWTYQERILA